MKFEHPKINRMIRPLLGRIMRIQYLHISAYSCDRCGGPVISGLLAIRENEISRESQVTQVGAVCLACGNKHSKATELNIVRHFPPVEWASTNGVDVAKISTAFVEMLDRAT